MSKTIVTNRKALRDYEVLESLEAGIELKGPEVKSLRDAKVNLNDSFARIEKGELFLYNAHISQYSEASYLNVDPVRTRKLLLHKGQIQKLTDKLASKGLTLIPLKAYFNHRGYAKVEIALCKGKKLYDKRDDIKRKEVNLDIRRALKHKGR
jgi:SsrA-binding protein